MVKDKAEAVFTEDIPDALADLRSAFPKLRLIEENGGIRAECPRVNMVNGEPQPLWTWVDSSDAEIKFRLSQLDVIC